MKLPLKAKLAVLIGLFSMLAVALAAFIERQTELIQAQVDGIERADTAAIASFSLAKSVEQAVSQVGAVLLAPDTATARNKSLVLQNNLRDVDAQRRNFLSKVGDYLSEAEKTRISLSIDEFVAYQADTAKLCLELSPKAAIIQANDESTVENRGRMLAEVERLRNAIIKNSEATRLHYYATRRSLYTLLYVVPALALAFGMLMAVALFRRQEAQTHKQHFDRALENMSQGLCIIDDSGQLLVTSRRFPLLFRLSGDLIGQSIQDVARQIIGAAKAERSAALEFLVGIDSHVQARKPAIFTTTLGESIFNFHFDPLDNGGVVILVEDVTAARSAARKIERLAMYDALTGLPNRAQFYDKIEKAMARFAEDKQPFSVLCIDLDAFKEVNDSLGHFMGDKLLIEASRRLSACVRANDLVARLGGDEFVILLAPSADGADLEAICPRLISEIARPFDIDGHCIEIGVSIGVAHVPQDGQTVDQVLANADLALYQAKDQGRGCYRFFSQDMQEKVERRRILETDLRHAAANGELDVYYQPIVNTGMGRIDAFEALLRWRHPTMGFVSPAEFIPVAEASGTIVEIGQWVLARACHDAAAWPDDIRVAVNVSPLQFRSGDIIEQVMQALLVSGLPPNRLEIEVTETAVIQDPDVTLAIFQKLSRFGVRLALDDFGTGYSSLSYLSRFPFHKIKIDRAFVKNLEDPKSLAVVGAMTQLAKHLDASLVVEGVETTDQLDVLRRRGVTTIQGFLYSQPRPVAEIAAMIEAITLDRHQDAA